MLISLLLLISGLYRRQPEKDIKWDPVTGLYVCLTGVHFTGPVNKAVPFSLLKRYRQHEKRFQF
jgi:hypothetical protein